MKPPALPGRGTVERGLARLAGTSHRHPFRAFAAAALVLVVAGVGLERLSINADLTDLLPNTFESVRDLDQLEKRFGGVGYLVVVARGAPPEVLRELVDDLVPMLESLDSVRYVQHRRPSAFFERHGLYFLSLEELKRVRERIGERVAWEKRQLNPFFIDFEENEPPSLDFSDLRDAKHEAAWIDRQGGAEYFIDEHEGLIALMIKPAHRANDLEFSSRFVERVRAALSEIDLHSYAPGLEVAFTGRFQKRMDLQTLIREDIARTSLIALALVMLYLVVHFRRLLAVVFMLGPLVTGLVATYGYAGLRFGALNILTAFIGAILIGLGIDHGIHLLDRYQADRKRGRTTHDAVASAFSRTGRAVLVASLTTVVGFVCLSLSEFRAFREFGELAALGMVFIVLAYFTLLPASLSLAEAIGWRPAAVEERVPRSHLRALFEHPRAVLAIGIVVVVAGALSTPAARFNYDFAALEASHLPSFTLDQRVNRLLGYSQTPAVLFADAPEEASLIAAALRERVDRLGADSTIDIIASASDLVPEQQAEKQELIAEIGRALEGIDASRLSPREGARLERARRMAASAPFDRDDLPESVKHQFFGVPGQRGAGFVLAFPAIRLSDGSRIDDFAREVRHLELPNGHSVSAAGEALILADILQMIRSEALPVLAFTVIGVTATLGLLLGSMRWTLICLFPALATLLVTTGLFYWGELRWNYLNVIVVPILFGIAIDAGAHLVTRFRSGAALLIVISETGRSVASAILTTMIGFGALLLASHSGLRSLGEAAVLGSMVNLLVTLVGLPAALAWIRRRDEPTTVSQES